MKDLYYALLLLVDFIAAFIGVTTYEEGFIQGIIIAAVVLVASLIGLIIIHTKEEKA